MSTPSSTSNTSSSGALPPPGSRPPVSFPIPSRPPIPRNTTSSSRVFQTTLSQPSAPPPQGTPSFSIAPVNPPPPLKATSRMELDSPRPPPPSSSTIAPSVSVPPAPSNAPFSSFDLSVPLRSPPSNAPCSSFAPSVSVPPAPSNAPFSSFDLSVPLRSPPSNAPFSSLALSAPLRSPQPRAPFTFAPLIAPIRQQAMASVSGFSAAAPQESKAPSSAYSLSVTRSNAAALSSFAQTERKSPASSSYQPPILNSGALEFSRRGQPEFTPKDVYCILKRHIKDGTPFDEIPNRLAKDKPCLLAYLGNAPESVIETIHQYAPPNERQYGMISKVKDAFFWVHLKSLENARKLSPCVIFFTLREQLLEGNGMEDIAKSAESRKLEFLRQYPIEKLERLYEEEFLTHEPFDPETQQLRYPLIQDLLLPALRRLHLRALEDSPINKLAEGLEEEDGCHLRRYLAVSDLPLWQNLLSRCGTPAVQISSWKEVGTWLKTLSSLPVPHEQTLCEQQMQKLRHLMAELTTLRSALALLDPFEEGRTTIFHQLRCLVLGAHREDYRTKMFPLCCAFLDSLHNQLEMCKNELRIERLQKDLVARFNECQRIHASCIKSESKPHKEFFDHFAVPIYQASLCMMLRAVKGSLPAKASWPEDLRTSWQQALEQCHEVSEEALLACQNPRQFEQFFHCLWELYAHREPADVLKSGISALDEDLFKALLALMNEERDHGERYKVLDNFFEPFKDLVNLKNCGYPEPRQDQ